MRRSAQLRHKREDGLGAEHHVGVGQQLTGAGGQAGQSIRADADDGNAEFGVAHNDLGMRGADGVEYTPGEPGRKPPEFGFCAWNHPPGAYAPGSPGRAVASSAAMRRRNSSGADALAPRP